MLPFGCRQVRFGWDEDFLLPPRKISLVYFQVLVHVTSALAADLGGWSRNIRFSSYHPTKVGSAFLSFLFWQGKRRTHLLLYTTPSLKQTLERRVKLAGGVGPPTSAIQESKSLAWGRTDYSMHPQDTFSSTSARPPPRSSARLQHWHPHQASRGPRLVNSPRCVQQRDPTRTEVCGRSLHSRSSQTPGSSSSTAVNTKLPLSSSPEWSVSQHQNRSA